MTFGNAFDPFRSLGSAWKLVRVAPLALLIGGVILTLTDGGNGGSSGVDFRKQVNFDTGEIDWSVLAPLLGALGVFVCCLALAFFVLHSWVWIGFAGAVERVMRTGATDLGVLFEGQGRLPTLIITRLVGGAFELLCWMPFGLALGAGYFFRGGMQYPPIAFVIAGAAALVSLCAWTYVGLGLSLAKPAVALEGLHPLDALNRSWTLARGNRLALFWFFFVTRIFATLGICLCCIGVFLTCTLYYTARVESYLLLTRGDDMNAWWSVTGRAPETSGEWGAKAAPNSPG